MTIMVGRPLQASTHVMLSSTPLSRAVTTDCSSTTRHQTRRIRVTRELCLRNKFFGGILHLRTWWFDLWRPIGKLQTRNKNQGHVIVIGGLNFGRTLNEKYEWRGLGRQLFFRWKDGLWNQVQWWVDEGKNLAIQKKKSKCFPHHNCEFRDNCRWWLSELICNCPLRHDSRQKKIKATLS